MTEQEDESELKDLRKLLQEKDAEIFALKQKLLFKFGAIQYDEVLNNTPSPDHNEGHV